MKGPLKGASTLAGVFSVFLASAPSTHAKTPDGTQTAAGIAPSPAALDAIRARATVPNVQLANKKFARVRTAPGGPWTQWKGQSAPKPRPRG